MAEQIKQRVCYSCAPDAEMQFGLGRRRNGRMVWGEVPLAWLAALGQHELSYWHLFGYDLQRGPLSCLMVHHFFRARCKTQCGFHRLMHCHRKGISAPAIPCVAALNILFCLHLTVNACCPSYIARSLCGYSFAVPPVSMTQHVHADHLNGAYEQGRGGLQNFPIGCKYSKEQQASEKGGDPLEKLSHTSSIEMNGRWARTLVLLQHFDPSCFICQKQFFPWNC